MRRLWTVGVALSLVGLLTGVAHADEVTSRISVDADGAQGNGESRSSSLSADGRYVAFDSNATNLVPGDTNGSTDVFVHDVAMSADGQHISYNSGATNLVDGDTNAAGDVFVSRNSVSVRP